MLDVGLMFRSYSWGSDGETKSGGSWRLRRFAFDRLQGRALLVVFVATMRCGGVASVVRGRVSSVSRGISVNILMSHGVAAVGGV